MSFNRCSCFVLIAILIASFMGLSQVQAQPTLKLNGYMQTTMIKDQDNKAFVFGFERVRLGLNGALNDKMDYKFLVDFIDSPEGIGPDGDTPKMINYAFVTVKPWKKLKLSIGKMKPPVGMEWNTAAHSLDFVKRGYAQKFHFHFDTGALLHMSGIGAQGLGFAIGAFNAGPNKANNVGDPAEGQDYTLAGRLNAKPNKQFYAEVYWGSALTSVDAQKNVNIVGAGVKWFPTDQIEVKGEYITRDDKQNAASDGNVYYAQAGFLLTPAIQPVVKYESDDITDDTKDQTFITVGCNFFLNPDKRKESKIQLNYVISDLDNSDSLQLLFQGAF